MPDVTDQVEIDIQSVQHLVALDPDVLSDAIASAQRKGIRVEAFINLAVRDAMGHNRAKAR